jgi:hypothetical protein
VAGGQEAVEVGEVTEDRVDGAVVADVVTEVGHGGAVDRRQPDRVGAQVDEMVEVAADAGQVADAVAVGVGERPRVDLVDDSTPPPRHPLFLPPIRLKTTRQRVTAL